MTVVPNHPHRYTLAEYLAFENDSELKHEFHNGEILAMSGASPEHALITARMIRAIGNSLQGKPCEVYSSDLKIGVTSAARVCYPDGSIICGPLQFHPDDPKHQIVINPRVIIEVLSPTTEAYDRGEKFRDYRTLASLEEYVLISEATPLIETFVRRSDGKWLIAGTYASIDAIAVLRSLNLNLKLADIYVGITFPEPVNREPERDGV